MTEFVIPTNELRINIPDDHQAVYYAIYIQLTLVEGIPLQYACNFRTYVKSWFHVIYVTNDASSLGMNQRSYSSTQII